MTGANSLEAASILLSDIRKMLSAAHFDLRKYCANHPRLLSELSDKDKEPYLQIGKNEVVKALGLIWQPIDDAFVYHFKFESSQKTTKRTVLSNLGRIFDPLGLIGPVVVLGKIFLQQLWKLKVSWDQRLECDYEKRWNDYLTQLQLLNDYRIPRHLLTKKHMHVGAHSLFAIIRQIYWPLDGLHICRNTVHRCIRCFRTKPSKNDPLMGSLPKDRVTPGRAFLTTGIDFCGPVLIHSRIRGRAPTKAYLCIFVCFTTKAVHIETVSDLSTPAFIAALRRFIARRGLIKTIWSDNATNFLGAKNELMELKRLFETENHKAEVLKLCQDGRIDWRTIPPRSPHFGGLWEAAVKQTKYHLIRVVANATLTFEEMTTLTAQIEAILNSRPLTPLSSDPND